MKVVAFNGSPRAEGNTTQALTIVLGELQNEGIETELIQIGHKRVNGCLAEYECMKRKDCCCFNKKDEVNDWIQKMFAADGVVLGSPTYVANVSAPMKALMDRSCIVARANNNPLRRKVGAAVTAVRRAGSLPCYDAMNHWFGLLEMPIATSIYWNMGIGLHPGDVLKDEEGIKTYHALGQNLAWMLKKLNA